MTPVPLAAALPFNLIVVLRTDDQPLRLRSAGCPAARVQSAGDPASWRRAPPAGARHPLESPVSRPFSRSGGFPDGARFQR